MSIKYQWCLFYTFFIRFVNLVERSSLQKKLIWSYVKRLRIEYLIKNTDITCEKNFIPLENILKNVNSFSKMVRDENSQEISRNLSRREINFGAKMFIVKRLGLGLGTWDLGLRT